MRLTITRQITPRKPRPFRAAGNVLLLLAAIPVVAIAGISLLLYMAFLWVRNLFTRHETVADPYHLELTLVQNDWVTITLTEDEHDLELTELNEAWMEQVYDEETALYRVTTVPRIDALHGKICCFYLKEMPGGALLQVLHPLPETGQLLNTQLVFLHYPGLQVSVVDEAGPFYLYNEEKNAQLIKGFNRKENIVIEIAGP